MATAKLSHRLTTQDASFLYGESESTPLHFSGLATFEGSIYFAKLCIYMERRLPLLPRFRQRLVFAPLNLAHPALEDDPDFQLDNHLFHHQLPEGSNDDAALHAVAIRIFEPPMDRSRQREPGHSRLRIGCPVSVRSDDEMGTLGDRVSMMIPEREAAPIDPVARLKSICEETRRLKASNQAQAADVLMTGADLIPPAAMGLASSIASRAIDSAASLAARAPMIARMMAPRSAAINFIATNVAGPRGPVYLAGHHMLDYAGMIPLSGNVGTAR